MGSLIETLNKGIKALPEMGKTIKDVASTVAKGGSPVQPTNPVNKPKVK